MPDARDEFGDPVPMASADARIGLHHATAEVNGTRLHYVSAGSGPTVVLLHGWPFTWAAWRPVMPLLVEAGLAVIAPDLRGFGRSAETEAGYDKVNVAQDVLSLVRSLGLGRVDLVGTDIGAMVAYAYASRHPDEVGRLVLAESLVPGFGLEERMDPANGGSWHFGFHAQVETATMLTAGREREYLSPWWSMMSARAEGGGEAEAAFLDHFTAPGGMRAGFRHYEAMLEDGRANRAHFTGRLATPTLVLNGEKGIPQAWTLGSVTQVAADLEHDVVPDAGHSFALDQPAWTAGRLARFLASSDRR